MHLHAPRAWGTKGCSRQGRPDALLGLPPSSRQFGVRTRASVVAPVVESPGSAAIVSGAGASTQIRSPAASPVSVWYAPSGQPASSFHGVPLVGRPDPMGASLESSTGGINFAVYTGSAAGVSLVLFTEADLQAGQVTHEIPLNPDVNRTGDIWHILLPKLRNDLLYGYRVNGLHQDQTPTAPGHRHDDAHVVLDPYARSILSRRRWGQVGAPLQYGAPGVLGLMDTWPQAAGSLPCPSLADFDWEGDQPLNLPMEQLVIYEAHVRGFTQHPSSGVASPGTYAGMIEKLDYLQSLGVTALELMPVFEFNELEYYSLIPGSETQYRYNFWGYSTVGFFAPMSRFSAAVSAGAPVRQAQNEFKTLVKECHRRGIEVILDVVFNHTAEGNDKGPTISFRGLDNRTYYMLAPGGEYYNYSGCGNTLNCNQPTVRTFILDCLRHWVTEYHVDGFRFDLASILTRAQSAWHPEQLDEDGLRVLLNSGGAVVNEQGVMTNGAGVPTGTPLPDPPVVEVISEDPILRNTKMIAEAWDCDGLNQVGAFPHYGGRWAEWNGKFRDVVRQFVKGTDGPWAGDFASAICGSPNIYANNQPAETDWWANNGGRKWRGNRGPTASVNFITAHDGFTLADVVAFNEKHNEANGENNRDGESHNLSWNCGHEGRTDRWDVNRLRQRQMRNLATALLVSHGVPMLLMGDEYGHSKGGNNNTYCHDSDLNYFRWDLAAEDPHGFARFMRLMINFRRSRPELLRPAYVNDKDVQWHGEQPNKPDWTEASRLVAFTMPNHEKGGGLFVAFNTSHVPHVLTLPRWGGRVWRPVVDTSKVAPYDFLVADGVLSESDVAAALAAHALWAAEGAYPLLPWSTVILESVPEDPSSTLVYRPPAAAARSGTSAHQGGGRSGGGSSPSAALWGSLPRSFQAGASSAAAPLAAARAAAAAAASWVSTPPSPPPTPERDASPPLQAARGSWRSAFEAEVRSSGSHGSAQPRGTSPPVDADAPPPPMPQAPPPEPDADELERLARENLDLRRRLGSILRRN